MPVLRKFMCCCQLTTGAVVIGFVGLAFKIVLMQITIFILTNAHNTYNKEQDATALRTTLITSLVSHIISIVSHICLIWGACVKNRFFLLPWLISTMIIIVALSITNLIFAFGLASIPVNRGVGVLIFIVIFLITGIIKYLWLCILSLFKELRETADDGILLTPPEYSSSPPYNKLKETC